MTKVPYLTFCDKMRQFLTKEMDRAGGNKEKMRKRREWISFHFLIHCPFPLHFLIYSPFPHLLSISSFALHFLFIFSYSLHFLTARLAGWQAGTSCAALWLGVIGWTLRAVLSQVPGRAFLGWFVCEISSTHDPRSREYTVDWKVLKLLKTLTFRKLLILLYFAI